MDKKINAANKLVQCRNTGLIADVEPEELIAPAVPELVVPLDNVWRNGLKRRALQLQNPIVRR